MGCDDKLYQRRIRQGALIPGKVDEEQFLILVEMSSLRSEKMVEALLEHLVHGKSRVSVCEKYAVESRYFSTSLNRLQRLSYFAAQIAGYYG
ncbi:major pilu subunit operon regulatory protein PapB [Escherichia coli]|uniref:PapB/FocB family fimbrial expression transcriptional regulator n=1 Tax=Escherichia coli TaxID=562 RepID=UPI001917CDB3|nr:PapB/FocB family fimbrial expression transcriptional regulator [Escherichia coli]CAD5758943.1 major pilu subunit operon regulatory protein PapB [Escherichia coli]